MKLTLRNLGVSPKSRAAETESGGDALLRAGRKTQATHTKIVTCLFFRENGADFKCEPQIEARRADVLNYRL